MTQPHPAPESFSAILLVERSYRQWSEKCLDPVIFRRRGTPIRRPSDMTKRERSFKGGIMAGMERPSSTLTTITIMVRESRMATTGIGRTIHRFVCRSCVDRQREEENQVSSRIISYKNYVAGWFDSISSRLSRRFFAQYSQHQVRARCLFGQQSESGCSAREKSRIEVNRKPGDDSGNWTAVTVRVAAGNRFSQIEYSSDSMKYASFQTGAFSRNRRQSLSWGQPLTRSKIQQTCRVDVR